jgi:hypothetical protein
VLPLNHLHIVDVLNTLLFGPKREEVRGEWGDLYNERLIHFYKYCDRI